MGAKRTRAFVSKKPDEEKTGDIYGEYTKELEEKLLAEIEEDKALHSFFACGRPKAITPKIQLLLLQAFSLGCTDKQAFAYCAKRGYLIHESTFYDFLRDNPDFRSKRDSAKQNPIMLAKGCVLNGLSTDPRLAMDYLKNKCSDEFKQGLNVNGVVGNADISIDQIKKMKEMLESDEECYYDNDGQENSELNE